MSNCTNPDCVGRILYDASTEFERTERCLTHDGEAFYHQVDEVGFTQALDNYTAVGLAEGFIEPDSEDQVIAAWQHLHNTGLAYQLQGFFGRTARHLIEQGIISA